MRARSVGGVGAAGEHVAVLAAGQPRRVVAAGLGEGQAGPLLEQRGQERQRGRVGATAEVLLLDPARHELSPQVHPRVPAAQAVEGLAGTGREGIGHGHHAPRRGGAHGDREAVADGSEPQGQGSARGVVGGEHEPDPGALPEGPPHAARGEPAPGPARGEEVARPVGSRPLSPPLAPHEERERRVERAVRGALLVEGLGVVRGRKGLRPRARGHLAQALAAPRPGEGEPERRALQDGPTGGAP